MNPKLIGKGEQYGWKAEPRNRARQALEEEHLQEGQEEVSKQTEEEPYDRDARRAVDNAHGNTVSPDTYDLEGDDVARAVYPDPKARHLKQDSDLLADKRELRAKDDGFAGQTADEPITDPRDTAAVKMALNLDDVPEVTTPEGAAPARRTRKK